ncbi:hypothetical protein H2509_05945 [Stappia sp. F7233]|uniref:Uncharacterized protein n=1 Tax=Stappia albiluteola TaxID=2758565 RepID=A0A839ABX1_9HYPH|nr:hypothetical protein [Stappia albiluteola]MBA5776666.1 hypothetical protein [Stappia albiluteola]
MHFALSMNRRKHLRKIRFLWRQHLLVVALSLVSTVRVGLADEIDDFVAHLPSGIQQMSVVAGPGESGARFVVLRLEERDRLFVQWRGEDTPARTMEIVELRESGERVLDLRSEIENGEISAFVDTATPAGDEVTYELFIESGEKPAYIFRETTN